MANNSNLGAAKAAKNDEFYTQYADIQKEINAYLEYNPDTFRDKTVLLPCDDPEWSNFTRFFAQNFERLGLKKLISTSYAVESKKYKDYEPTLFETEIPLFDEDKTRTHGKIFVLERDVNGSGRIDIDDLEWHYLDGDGDFRSPEVCALRDEADVIVTNPPFSLFREFLSWIVVAGKECLIIGNMNAVTYKEVFPLIMANKLWEPLMTMAMKDQLRYSKHKDVRDNGYSSYDNYDALDIPYTDAIPDDYDGEMGVPITFLDKYCPDQFEIIGISKTWFGFANKIYPEQIQHSKDGRVGRVTKLNDGPAIKLSSIPENETYYTIADSIYRQEYARIFIRKKQ